MKDINTNRIKLINILKKNRILHIKEFEKAEKGYIKFAKLLYKKALTDLKKTKKVTTYFNLTKPINSVEYYDNAMEMLSMSVDENVLLAYEDFKTFIKDDWSWKDNYIGNIGSMSIGTTNPKVFLNTFYAGL